MHRFNQLIILVFVSITLAMPVFAVSPPNQVDTSGSGGYQLLAPIPLSGANSPVNQSADFATYIPGIIKLTVGIATALAVIMLMVGGFEYILSASAITKANGKGTIQNALIGLGLALTAYAILYTINPALTQFNLSISPLHFAPISTQIGNVPVSSPTPTTGGGGGGGTSGGGVQPGTNNCGSSCVPSQTFSFPQKGPGGACTGNTCYIDPALGSILVNINAALSAKNVGWQVTEMVPPTVPHLDSCHGNGTCVDASLFNPSVANIVTLFKTLDAQSGIGYEYEVCDPQTLSSLQNNPQLAQWSSKIKCESTTQNGASGQSFHINGPNAGN